MTSLAPYSFLDIPMAGHKAGDHAAASRDERLNSPGLAAPDDLDGVTTDLMFSLG